jgi:hypothetical protein
MARPTAGGSGTKTILLPLPQTLRTRWPCSSPRSALVWLLGFLVTVLAAVPFAGYYLCARVIAPDNGYAAGWLLFFAGFIVLGVSGNRLKYRQDLKRLEAEDDTSVKSPGLGH